MADAHEFIFKQNNGRYNRKVFAMASASRTRKEINDWFVFDDLQK